MDVSSLPEGVTDLSVSKKTFCIAYKTALLSLLAVQVFMILG
jgi:hypothetical protein